MQIRAALPLAAALSAWINVAAATERPATWIPVERQIADEVNAYRASTGLPAVPYSPSLTMVAHAHVVDLADNRPDMQQSEDGRACLLHSWSQQGAWTPVCWTGAAQDAPRMWSKPREITRGLFKGNGYEIVFGPASGTGDGRPVTSAAALNGWRGSPLHNAVVLERGAWTGRHWRAMGVGALGGFAVVWFSDTPDAAHPPVRPCGACQDR
ncbi:MAG: CAP domain-containing protein [Caulobacteraceae bacterium]